MSNCQICQEEIWGTEWPMDKENNAGKFVCFYCYQKVKDKNSSYQPEKPENADFDVCDSCGEITSSLKMVNFEMVCEDCGE